ncbi:GTP-binding protein [Mangrovimonas spongiae]|uniref:GTP-binding protein n=1 Tax=Mangrovimonas spongiae TaxID=2494697 RepID=A0A3R9MFA3_9FLAO|nr:GTP-binding protein [Mangrovimonas spongiae]RSK39068.1 GTP-binding protein [Mangrovimonas spongiae]
MSNTNEIVLRPRFKKTLNIPNDKALQAFEHVKTSQKAFIVSRVDDHIFIKLPIQQRHFWTPQLHLEINHIDKSSSILYGLFGPSPTVWTMFMFFHFIVATLFIGFSIWAYTNYNLDQDYIIQIFLMFLMIVVWFVLYAFGRLGKQKGQTDMKRLYNFMKKTLNLS